MKRVLFAMMMALVAASCGGSDSAGQVTDAVVDTSADVLSGDTTVLDLAGFEVWRDDVVEVAPVDVAVADEASAPDPTPDPTPVDLAPDPVAPDPVADEAAAPDPTPVDTAVPETALEDQGPDLAGLSDNAAACVYVMDSICSKMLVKCDMFGLIPASFTAGCTGFLTGNNATIILACNGLDNAQTTDPTIALIQSYGPTALKNCTDNFKCDLNTATTLYNIGTKAFGGQKLATSDILNIVVQLCFPQ